MTKKINVYFLLFFLASFLFSEASSAEIDNLFNSLKNASDVSTAKKYEEKIWEYWLTSGSNENNNTLMTKGVKLINKLSISALIAFENIKEAKKYNKK